MNNFEQWFNSKFRPAEVLGEKVKAVLRELWEFKNHERRLLEFELEEKTKLIAELKNGKI